MQATPVPHPPLAPATPALSGRRLLISLKSPLQAINAIEYCHSAHPGPADSVTVLLFGITKRKALNETVAELLRSLVPGIVVIPIAPGVPGDHGWRHAFNERKRARAFLRKLNAILASIPPPTELLIGDFRSRECRHVAAAPMAAEALVVLLDDGSATHQIAKFRRDSTASDISPIFPERSGPTRRLRFWGVRLPPIPHATFFTHYDIVCPPQDSVIRHTYRFWRSRIKDRALTTTDDVLFLGMSHVEKGLTQRDRYLDVLRAIKAHYGSRPIYYRPHRDEAPDKLASVEQLGFTLAPSATPIELLLLQSHRLPHEVAAIASSALDNLALLFGDQIKLRCFAPPAGYCNPKLSAHFTDIIRYHQRNLHRNLETTTLPRSSPPAPPVRVLDPEVLNAR